MESIKLFDYTTNFCSEKADLREHPDFLKTYNPFMINRVMSMSPKTCHLAMFMSQRPQIPNAQHFIFYNNELDRDRIFFNYAKRSDEVSAETIQYIREYWQCSLGRALEYINILSEKQLKTIIDIFKTRDGKPKKRKVKKGK
jgi:hypothetical protein